MLEYKISQDLLVCLLYTKVKKPNKLKIPYHFSLMWEMLYSFPESEPHVVLLLLVTLFSVFSSLVSSLTTLLTCPLGFGFFFLCPYNFPAFFSLYTCFTPACWVFFSLAAKLHICLLPLTFLSIGVERSTGSPQIKCRWWPPNSSYVAVRQKQTGNSWFCFQLFLVGGGILVLKSQDHQQVVCVGALWNLFVLERMRA